MNPPKDRPLRSGYLLQQRDYVHQADSSPTLSGLQTPNETVTPSPVFTLMQKPCSEKVKDEVFECFNNGE